MAAVALHLAIDLGAGSGRAIVGQADPSGERPEAWAETGRRYGEIEEALRPK